MSMFTVVPFVHELKGKQASPVPHPPPSLPLADHRARPTGHQLELPAGRQGGCVYDSAAENLQSVRPQPSLPALNLFLLKWIDCY